MPVVFKRVHFSVVTPKGTSRRIVSAGARRVFSSLGIEACLSRFVEQLEKLNPGVEWRLVPIGPNRFNFICKACDAGMEAAS
jgi:hypothetical protein